MKTDTELQQDVQNAIESEHLLGTAEIGIIAQKGILSLTGVVESYAKRLEVEIAASKVIGVKELVEKIEVKFPI